MLRLHLLHYREFNPKANNMNSEEAHQLMLERMQRLEEALDRAELGLANREDWDVIRYECGMSRTRSE
jgi:hypothetical protein